MDSVHFSTLLSAQVPPLPDLNLLWAARHLSWACVMVFLALVAAQGGPRWVRWPSVLGVLAWTLAPGSWSLAYWLGLAFQMPSLSTTLLCLGGIWLKLRTGRWTPSDAGHRQAWARLGLVGIVLGWLLLLDTFAVWPVSLYALGFSPLLPLIVGLLALLPWMVWGNRHPGSVLTWLLMPVIALYGTLHLPNGNLWDALLDPWLWIVLQLGWLWRAARWFRDWRGRQREQPLAPEQP